MIKRAVFAACGAGWLLLALAALGITFAIVAADYRPARGQHATHEQHHNYYQGWFNSNGHGCCNNKDCREIPSAHEREVGGRLEVWVQGVGVARGQSEWCPVLPHHYLKKGANVPNAAASHICVSDHYGATSPCAQFICFQPQPRT